jgi:hypothetical protein
MNHLESDLGSQQRLGEVSNEQVIHTPRDARNMVENSFINTSKNIIYQDNHNA